MIIVDVIIHIIDYSYVIYNIYDKIIIIIVVVVIVVIVIVVAGP